MAKSKLHTSWDDAPSGNRKPKTGSGPPAGMEGSGTTNYPRTVSGPSNAKAGGALPKSLPAGERSTNYIRGTDRGKGASGGDEHNASAGRIRDIGAPSAGPNEPAR